MTNRFTRGSRWLMRLLVLAALGTAAIPKVSAQEYQPVDTRREINLESFVQDLFAVQDEEVNYEDLYETLFQLYANPLDLNEAGREELTALYILSAAQVDNFLNYRARYGRLLSIYELQAIPGFDLPVIYKLLPFVTVQFARADGRSLWERMKDEPNHYLLLRYSRLLERQKGFTPPDTATDGSLSSRYLGSPDRLYARYRISHARDFSLGFTAEKDAGEQWVWHPRGSHYGADFVSFHASLQNRGRWKNLLLGDYQVQFGQGLVLSAGFSAGKGAETIATIRRSNLGIRPYTSVMESGFFRGVAATYQVTPRITLTGLVSRTRRDASLSGPADSLETPEDYTGSLQLSGLHRTVAELRNRAALTEQNLGGNILYASTDGRLQVGCTFLQTSFGAHLQRGAQPYNLFEFRGRQNHVYSLSYTYTRRNANFFGEWARSRSGGVGGVSGWVVSLSPRADLAMLYRHFDPTFHSFYANAFGENTRTINEHGMYWGLKLVPMRRLTLSAYYDQFSFPWLRYQVNAPSRGYEYLLRLAYQPSRIILLSLQFREEEKGKNRSGWIAPVPVVVASRRRNYAVHVEYAAAKMITFKSRVQWSDYQQQGGAITGGFALIQDVNLEWKRWRLGTRFALFDTDDYNNRQYVYERDVLYSFSFPAYYNRGLRNYFLLQYQINQRIDCWVRWARTSLRDVDTVSSGLEEIDQPQRTDIRVQVRYKL